jgi:hypothetical protein
MGAYRKNPSDKQQCEIERAMDDSAVRVQWFDAKQAQVGSTVFVKADDLYQQRTATVTSPAMNNQKQLGHIIGNHNDKPAVFENPGRA